MFVIDTTKSVRPDKEGKSNNFLYFIFLYPDAIFLFLSWIKNKLLLGLLQLTPRPPAANTPIMAAFLSSILVLLISEGKKEAEKAIVVFIRDSDSLIIVLPFWKVCLNLCFFVEFFYFYGRIA